MEFLKRAEQYAAAQGDTDWFNHYYTKYREYHNVSESVWRTLSWIYGDDVAKQLEQS